MLEKSESLTIAILGWRIIGCPHKLTFESLERDVEMELLIEQRYVTPCSPMFLLSFTRLICFVFVYSTNTTSTQHGATAPAFGNDDDDEEEYLVD
jgi:hypothetical protein